MATQQLIPVFSGTIQNESIQMVDARTLHQFLGIARDFSTWLKKRIADYGFTLNQDYIQVIDSSAPQNGGASKSKTYGDEKIDYHLTLDMAKELAMVERNEKGRQIRRYFIECERRAHGAIQPQAPGALSPELQAALSSKAHQLALQDYENILADMTERARQYGRMGCTDAEILQRLNREPFPRMGLIPAENLQPVLGRIGDLFNAVSEVMDRSLDPGSRRLA